MHAGEPLDSREPRPAGSRYAHAVSRPEVESILESWMRTMSHRRAVRSAAPARRVRAAAALPILAALAFVRPALAEDGADAAMKKGREFLVQKQDAATGGWGDRFTGGVSAGYSAMAVAAV